VTGVTVDVVVVLVLVFDELVELPEPDELPLPDELPPPEDFAALLEEPAVDPVPELAFTCWVNGLRSAPVSRALLGVVVTLTAGSAGTGTPVDGIAGTWATAAGLLELLRIRGTAISATMSAAATGQSRFSRSSETRFWTAEMRG
jgi:hypothetical protein